MNFTVIIPIFIVGLLVQIAFIAVEKKEKYVPAVVLKGTASCFFIALGLLGYLNSPTAFSRLIFIGLIFGGIGDVCLNLRLVLKDGKKIFLAGIAAFLVGHLLYLAAMVTTMSSYAKSALLISIAAGIICAALLLIWIFKNITAQKVFKIFGIFYVGAVVVMTAVSIARVFCIPIYVSYTMAAVSIRLSAITFMIGAILFTLSDIILIFNMFSEHKKPWMRPTNLTLYYLGQMLIAASLLVALVPLV